MALNATAGSADANSYVTVAEASAYFMDRIHASAWESFEDQSSALITASRLLDWYMKWKGYRSSSTQSMQWPRMGVVRRDGSSVDSSIIPVEVKIAVYELALSSLEADRTADDPMAGIEQIKAGSLMIKADSGDVFSTAMDTIPEKISRILSDYISTGSLSVVRLMRG
jgi:hypothetical protein